MSEDLIKLFECESSFEIRKEIYNITNGLKLDLLVELNKAYYFDYLFKKLSEQVNKIPTESDEVLKKRLIEEGFEEVFDYIEFNFYTLENGFLTYNESKLKVQNVSLESYENLKNESYTFEEILNEYLNKIFLQQPEQKVINIIKVPQDDINVFLCNKVNIEIYENLKQFCKEADINTSILVLFNLIYKEIEFYFQNDKKYLEIQNHFKELDLLIYEFIVLSNMIFVIEEIYKSSEPNEVQLKCLSFLKDFFKQYVFSDEETTKSILDEYKLFKFKNRIKVWKTNEEKINYLLDLKARFLHDAVGYSGWENEFTFDKECDIEIERLKAKIHFKNNSINNDFVEKEAKDYQETIWFKTGIKLATGEAYQLYNKYKFDKGHFTKINLELGFKPTDRPYFSDTINDNDSDKNTFANKDKLKKLHQYIIDNNLNLGTEFLKKFNEIEPE
jgi:hypothetical protein